MEDKYRFGERVVGDLKYVGSIGEDKSRLRLSTPMRSLMTSYEKALPGQIANAEL